MAERVAPADATQLQRRGISQIAVQRRLGITESMFPRAGLDEDERKLVLEFLNINAKQ